MKLEQIIEGIQRRTQVPRGYKGVIPHELQQTIVTELNKMKLPGENEITLKDMNLPGVQQWMIGIGLHLFLEDLKSGNDEGSYFVTLSRLIGNTVDS